MKAKRFLEVIFASLVISAWPSLAPLANAAFDSGSTGADGALNPTANVQLQIPESGVFNFTTINIPSGVTVTFKKNTQNTPVTILASGDVTINGTISVNGSNGNYIIPGAGGPGGFDGGVGASANQAGRRGEGPGAGAGGNSYTSNYYGAGGGGGGGLGAGGAIGDPYWTGSAASGGSSYGNERILPLIGGSGGGGGGGSNTYVGGAGGGGAGAVLIASSGSISVNGSITANGGSGVNGVWDSIMSGGGGGSGGSIRLIANIISGNGAITANGGGGGGAWGSGGSGSVGRIRLEASSITRTSSTSPPFSMGYAYAVTPPNMPAIAITSIGGIDVPAIPKGGFGAPDIMLPFNTKNPITVVVTGTNIPVGTTVSVKTSPAVGNAASATATLSGTEASSTASVNLNISTAYPSLITASVTYQVAASNGGPIYAEGEKVEFVRIAANLGGESRITYITESGREVVAKM